MLKWNPPAGKHEYGGRALERTGKNLCALITQVLATVLDGGDGGLRYARKLGHADVSTTMIYTHVLKRGGRGVTSPLERA